MAYIQLLSGEIKNENEKAVKLNIFSRSRTRLQYFLGKDLNQEGQNPIIIGSLLQDKNIEVTPRLDKLKGIEKTENTTEDEEDLNVKNARIRSYCGEMQENADQKNTEYGHFSRSAKLTGRQ